MSIIAVTAPPTARHLTIDVDYGVADVERAADSLNVPLSSAEVEAILANVDGELPQLAAAATRSAVLSRIFEDLGKVAGRHAWSDDD